MGATLLLKQITAGAAAASVNVFGTSPNFNKVGLFKGAPALNEFTVKADLDIVTDGADPLMLTCAAGPGTIYRDPTDGAMKMILADPAAGPLLFQRSEMEGPDPVVVTGWFMTQADGDLLYAALLPAPITLDNALDAYQIDQVEIPFLPEIFA